MIFVHDKGRMANNMLQYGHVYAWGREHGRRTVSMRFAYKYPWFRICHTRYHHFLTYVFAKYAAKWGLIPTVRFDEEGADYSHEEELMKKRRLVVVGGWWARWYDLFLKYKPEIVDIFAFDEQVRRNVEGVFRGRRNEEGGTRKEERGARKVLKLGVHIRRGDYRQWHGGRYFFTDEQYLSVIRRFLTLHQDQPVQVFICGNDPSLHRERFQQALEGCSVVFPMGNPAEDMCLLSECDYLIGPPSTFTLVASMYHDRPLYWITDPEAPVTEESFGHFDDLFRYTL